MFYNCCYINDLDIYVFNVRLCGKVLMKSNAEHSFSSHEMEVMTIRCEWNVDRMEGSEDQRKISPTDR